jgi:N-methylhydantoinase A
MLLGVDVGGTFTDAVLVDEDSLIHTAKVPTTPADQSLGVLQAVGLLLERVGVGAEDIERFSHGMTVATNALIEGRTARTALIATEGFTDLLDLARQTRPHLYRLCLSHPPPLVPAALRFPAPERNTPDGPLLPLDPAAAEELVDEVAGVGPQAVAVSLLHSYAHPSHESMLGELLSRAIPGAHISLSHDLVGTFREYERTATTVLDAALSPLLSGYLHRLTEGALERGLPAPQIMQSSGGLTDGSRAAAHAALTVLSGPAGGVAGAVLLAALAGEPDVLCLDMGGTSCDVCLISGSEVPETSERTIAGRPLALPTLDIHTVGAGGGSIAWRDPGGALRVGPTSAGADPGPACYGRGGLEPTVTDANLLLGRLLEGESLPGGLELDREAAERAVGGLAVELEMDTLACARGIIRVTEGEMLRALRVMTVERGIDPRGLTMMAFGGAGPLHAAALARSLGISRILCPRASGVLSALGLAAAAPRRDLSRTVMLTGEALTMDSLARARESMLSEASRRLASPPAEVRVSYDIRYRGQSFELSVKEGGPHLSRGVEKGRQGTGRDGGSGLGWGPGLDWGPALGWGPGPDPEALREAFGRAHAERYGYRDEEGEVEVVNIRVSALGAAPALRPLAAGGQEREPTLDWQEMAFDGEPIRGVAMRGAPAPGDTLEGPMICGLSESTLVVPEGWRGEVDEQGTIHLRDEL